MNTKWAEHNEWERTWWGACANTFEEQLKQEVYAAYMRLSPQFVVPGHWFDMKGRSVLDVGGGPCSLLLRCRGFPRAVVVDPCGFPEWVTVRYREADIEHVRAQAENCGSLGVFDEGWVYNCLQHVEDVAKVVQFIVGSVKKVRVFEYLNVGVCPGHPNNLTKELLDGLFGKKGLTEKHSGLVNGEVYFGVFNYGTQP